MNAAGLSSQSALARASGVSQSNINRILKTSGSQKIKTDTLAALAKACRVRTDWLLNGDSMNNTTSLAQHLVYLTSAELDIITQYREANDMGKTLVEVAVKTAPKQFSPLTPPPPLSSPPSSNKD